MISLHCGRSGRRVTEEFAGVGPIRSRPMIETMNRIDAKASARDSGHGPKSGKRSRNAAKRSRATMKKPLSAAK